MPTTYHVKMPDGSTRTLEFDQPPTSKQEVMDKIRQVESKKSGADPILTALGAWKGLFTPEAWKSLDPSTTTMPDLVRDFHQSLQYGKKEAQGFLGALNPVGLFKLAKLIKNDPKGFPAVAEQMVADQIDLKAESVGADFAIPAAGKAANVAGTAMVENPAIAKAVNTVAGSAAGALGAKEVGMSPFIGMMAGRNLLKDSKLPLYMGRGLQKITGGAPAKVATDVAETAEELDPAMLALKKSDPLMYATLKSKGVSTGAKPPMALPPSQPRPTPVGKPVAEAPVSPVEAAVEGRPSTPAPAPVASPGVAGAQEPPASAVPRPATPGGVRLGSRTVQLQQQVEAQAYRQAAAKALQIDKTLNQDPVQWDAATKAILEKEKAATAKPVPSPNDVPLHRQMAADAPPAAPAGDGTAVTDPVTKSTALVPAPPAVSDLEAGVSTLPPEGPGIKASDIPAVREGMAGVKPTRSSGARGIEESDLMPGTSVNDRMEVASILEEHPEFAKDPAQIGQELMRRRASRGAGKAQLSGGDLSGIEKGLLLTEEPK